MDCFICAGNRHPKLDPNTNKTQFNEKELANAIRYLVGSVFPISSKNVASTCGTCITLFEEMHRIMCEQKNLTNILNRLVALKYGLVDFTKPRIRLGMDETASRSFYPPNPKSEERTCRKCSYVSKSAAAVTAHYKYHLLSNDSNVKSPENVILLKKFKPAQISKTTQTTQAEVIEIDCDTDCSELADESCNNSTANLVQNTDDDIEIEQVLVDKFKEQVYDVPIDERTNPLAIQLDIVPAFIDHDTPDISGEFPVTPSQQYDHDYCEKLRTSSTDTFDSDSYYETYMNSINSRIEILKNQREHIERAQDDDCMEILLNTTISLSNLTPDRVEDRLVSLFSRESGIVRYNCSECRYFTKMKSYLHIHNQKHHNKIFDNLKKLTCEKCDAKFFYKHEIARHMRENHLKCRVCCIKFLNAKLLRRHWKYTHGNKIFECKFCGSSFICWRHRDQHENYCKSVQVKPVNHETLPYYMRKTNNEIKMICELCGRPFRSMHTFQLHMDQHGNEKPYKCEICDENFRNPYGLKVHVRKDHTKIPSHPCETCGKGFYTYISRRRHVIRVHTKKFPYSCSSCGLGFVKRSNMAHHMTIRHQDFSLKDQMKAEHVKYLEFPSAGIYVPPNIYKQNKV